MSYRGFPHASTGVSPYKLLRGHDMPLPWTFPQGAQVILPDLEPVELQAYMGQLGWNLEKWHDFAIREMAKQQERNKRDFDRRHQGGEKFTFKIGDMVFMQLPKEKQNKLQSVYEGPY